MFGRRRRPILGAAVVVGASRAAARHEVRKQGTLEAQREMEIQREVELRRRQEEEQELRTQRAVEEAMKKAALENQAAQQNTAAPMSPPPPQYYNNSPSMPSQTRDIGAYNPVANVVPDAQTVPPYSLGSQSRDGRIQSPQAFSSMGQGPRSNAQYCTQCGFACQAGDRFCRQCGAKQANAE